MIARLGLAAALLLACSAAVSIEPAPSPTPDAEAERIFAKARDAWRDRKEGPFVSYGALLRYSSGGHTHDNWWQAYYRESDQHLVLNRLVIPEDDAKRLKGFPILLPFGFKLFDTNPEAEPIRVDDPTIEPFESFGMLARAPEPKLTIETPTPGPSAPSPAATTLRELGHVEVVTREYDVRLLGTEHLRDGDAFHLTLTPLRDPKLNRLRELWVSTQTYATDRIAVQGILNGKPYDGVRWLVSYTAFGGREYISQIKSEAPLHFGLDTVVSQMEIDFVDYRFAEIPKYIFDRLRF